MLYIHIPFCKQACSYCDFHFSTSTRFKSDLVNSLLKEIQFRKDELHNPLQSVYIGGGTPSLLDALELDSILELVNSQWGIARNAEITLEANPDDLTLEKLKELKSLGINRLSIGVQSFFQEDLSFMNRAHNSSEALQCIELAAQTGFDRLSIDLIYGTPGLSDARWIENLEKASSLPVNHLSCYALTVEPQTPLAKGITLGKFINPDEEQAARQFEIMQQLGPKLGFTHYEISNLARNDAKAIHNSAYWEGKPYVGIGPSAHSFDGINRRFNKAHNAQYIQSLKQGDCIHELEFIDTKTRYNELILTGLRTMRGIEKIALIQLGKEYIQHFAKARKQLSNPEILQETETAFILNPNQWLFADGIAASLFY